MTTVEKIPLSSVIPSQNYRADSGDIEGLAASIKEHGLIHPIRVRKLGLGTYEIVAGFRRFEAHKLIGAKEIDAIVIEAEASNAAAQRLVENIQRKDLSPLEVARGISSLYSHFHMDDAAIAEKTGKSKEWVLIHRMLIKLPVQTLTRLTSAAESGGPLRVVGATPRHVVGLLRDLPTEEEAGDEDTKREREEGLKAVDRLITDTEDYGLNVYQTDFIVRKSHRGELEYDEALEFAKSHRSRIDLSTLPPPIETGKDVEESTLREYKETLEKISSLASEINLELAFRLNGSNRQKMATYLKEFVLDKLMRLHSALTAHRPRVAEQPTSIENRKELPEASTEHKY